MTVADLTKTLARFDQQAEVKIAVRVHTQGYAVAVCPIIGAGMIDAGYEGATIHISLPEKMHVVNRK